MTIMLRNDARGCYHPVTEECPNCPTERQYSGFSTPRIVLFRPALYENIALDPIQIDTPQQLATECERRGLTPQYLRDINLWRTKSSREI
jgi:hypothetical protein